MKANSHPPSVPYHPRLPSFGCVFLALLWLAFSPAPAQAATYALGTTALLEGPTAGTDSIVLAVSPETAAWTATPNDTWLHLTPANQSGTGSTNVIFNYDANPGATRTGTLTIAGQTLTITQAGSTYIAPGLVTTLVSWWAFAASGVAVDGTGNVYIADTFNNAIKQWRVSDGTVTTLVSSGLEHPYSVAVDGAGNVYIADTFNNAIKQWRVSDGTVTTLVSSGLNSPYAVAVDGAGNVYIADTFNNAIKQWRAADNTVTTLVSSGLNYPSGVAVDGAGNVYIADNGNNAMKKWTAANNTVTTLVSSGLDRPSFVAVDGAGSVYIADHSNAIQKWTAASNTVTTLVSSRVSFAEGAVQGVAVDGAGNVYIVVYGSNGAIKELPYAFVDPTARSESGAAGSDVLPVVLPAAANLLALFTPTSDQPWLTISGITNGVVSFTFTANLGTNRTAHLTLLGQTIPVTQRGVSLGTTALLEGPTAGTDSVVLALGAETFTWTATPNDAWLHLSAANQSGTGSTNVIFSFDANPDATRTGTLTIAGQTFTITQAGSTYIAAGPVTTVVPSGLSGAAGVAVDRAGNVYIADIYNNAIKQWMAASNTVTTLVSSGLDTPLGVAVDGAGNVYISDSNNHAIKKWTAANNTATTLVSSGLGFPEGVAVDGAGNVYIADANNAIKKWTAANDTVTPLVSSGLSSPSGVAVDGAGNVYIADLGNNAVKQWTAANNTVTTLVSTGLNQPVGVAVDGSGNVYIADSNNNAIKRWTAADNTVTTLVSTGLNQPDGVAVDGSGNVYIADSSNSAIKEVPRAFVDPTARLESAAAGSDVLPVVLPTTANLLAPFAPTSDQPWLTISGITNGVVSFAFTANLGANRTAHLTLLGQAITVMQYGPTYSLGTLARLEGPIAGKDSVVLAVSPETFTWTATTDASWLHLTAANQSGTGSTNVVFNYDANPGTTRTGTLTIAGLTLTITQAGSTYVAAPAPVTKLVVGFNSPDGVAVDGVGNLYISDSNNKAIYKWTAANSTVSTLVSSGLNNPQGVAVDGAGNVYFADSWNNAIKKWTAASNTVTTLVSSGLTFPFGVAVDGAGNVYIADFGNNAVKKWTAANNTVTTLVSSGLSFPQSVAVDGAGNVYIADNGNNATKKWTAANNTVTTLVSSGLAAPQGVAVDGAGNVYITENYTNHTLKKWTAANNVVTTLVSSELNYPLSVVVDAAGNVYIADSSDNAIKELPHAFLDPAAKSESAGAGSDALPVVLPATANLRAPFTPASDQPWLTITGITNGVVSFSFTANAGAERTAHLTLLGQTIPITQAASVTPPTLIVSQVLGNGVFQFAFSNNQDASFTVLSSTNVSLPLTNWTVVGAATNTAPGLFQFTTPPVTNDPQRFYRVRSP
jgi:DNA-binding beta-propeller fold protein YncE